MKKINYTLIAILATIVFTGCGSDESSTADDSSTVLELERETTTNILTASNGGVWRISEASLVNSSGTFNISNIFNVVDDEFIFSGTAESGMLQWRQGNAINIEATTIQEALLDYYKSPENYSSSFVDGTSNELTSLDGRFALTVTNSETINGVIFFANGEKLNLSLSKKLPIDYMSPPANGLNFTEAFIYESNSVSCCAPGMIGSYSNNSLYIVNTEFNLTIGQVAPERIVRFDVQTGTSQENLFYNEDFVSKQLHIINNQLVVIGGRYVNTYPLDLSGDPQSSLHGLSITRFGMAISDDDAYMVGGDLNNDPNTGLPVDAEKIYKWNIVNESLSFVTDLPEDRFGARSAIVNDKLYVFGGTKTFAPNIPDPNNNIYIYDINSGSMTTEAMPSGLEYSYVDKVQNLIYVAGYYNIADTSGNVYDREFIIGVYDTENGSFQELTHNLNSDGYNTIYGMCIFNNKLYVLHGLFDLSDPEIGQWSIMAADLN